MMENGGMNVDQDGFLVSAVPGVKSSPEAVAVPNFFNGCGSLHDAALKSIKELSKPYSVQQDGQDEMYARLSHALTVLLAVVAGVEP